MTPKNANGCPHPKDKRVFRIQRIKGVDVRVEVCEGCGLEMMNPVDAQDFLSNRASEEAPRWNVRQVILGLLGAVHRPIINRIVMMKEIFLLEKEGARELDINIERLGFVPYDYGPYSRHIDDETRQMEREGVIVIKREAQGQKEIISLTDQGKREADDVLRNLKPDKLELLRRKRKGWDQLGYSGILQKVYDEYPAYRSKSKIADEVLPTRRWT